MAVSEAKKRANAKWDSENMATLACKVKRTQAADFKSYCAERGLTSNTALKDYVLGCIGEGESPQEVAEGSTAVSVGRMVSLLPPDTFKAAQSAAEATGEGVLQFVSRAVETQAERDNHSWSLGINPATRERSTRRKGNG